MRALIRHWRAAVLVLLCGLLALGAVMHQAGSGDLGVYMLMAALFFASVVPDAWRRGRDG